MLASKEEQPLSTTEVELLTKLAGCTGGMAMRDCDAEYGIGAAVGLCARGYVSLLCHTVVIDDAYYCLTPEGRQKTKEYL